MAVEFVGVLGYLRNGGFAIVIRFCNEVVFYIQLFFASAHKVHSGLRLPLALLITIIHEWVKKIFSID